MTIRSAVISVAVVALFAIPLASAGAQPRSQRVGDLRFVDAHDADRALGSGGSTTEFALRLPDGASCPGDSEHDEWRTQAFLFAPSLDPATIQYNAAGPVGSGVFKFYFTTTRPYRHELLEPNDAAGQPGRIPPPPPMSFAVYPPGTIPPGRYVAAIGCTLNDALERWWGVELDIARADDDAPAQLHWQLAGASLNPSGSRSADHTLASIALLAIGAGALVLVIRSANGSRRRAVPSKETR